MKRIQFTTTIEAPREKVWEKLWNDESYRLWTAPFMEGSYAESDWKEGSKILFLTPQNEGMFGIIERMIPYQQMTFKHLGDVKNGVETPKDWGDSRESYHLEEKDGATILHVEMNAMDEFETYLSDAFPKALAKLKEIAEA